MEVETLEDGADGNYLLILLSRRAANVEDLSLNRQIDFQGTEDYYQTSLGNYDHLL
jgi:hypothetical protein